MPGCGERSLAGVDHRVPSFPCRGTEAARPNHHGQHRRDRDAAVNLLGVGFDGRQRWRAGGDPWTQGLRGGIWSEGRFGYLVEDRLLVQVGLIFDTAGWSSCRGDNTGPAGTFRPTSLGKRLPPNSQPPPSSSAPAVHPCSTTPSPPWRPMERFTFHRFLFHRTRFHLVYLWPLSFPSFLH